MNLNELTNLTDIAKHNEDVLNTKTTALRNEVRDWCLKELKSIEAEEKKLVEFVNDNSKVFCDKCGSPLLYRVGICYTGKPYSTGCGMVFYTLTMQEDRIRHTYESWYNSVSVSQLTTRVRGVAYPMELNIEYWTKIKDVIDFRRWQLGAIVENLKSLLNCVVNSQYNRMNGIVKVCNDISNEMNETEDVSVTITIKKV